jgi:hypothetical protein
MTLMYALLHWVDLINNQKTQKYDLVIISNEKVLMIKMKSIQVYF